MQNEEIRGLMHKKDYEDQFMAFLSSTFCQFKFGALSLFSLSITLGHLAFSWSTLALEQGRKSKQKEKKENKDQGRKSRIKQFQQEYLQVTFCMCDFLAGFYMHSFACWCMVLLLSVVWFFWVMEMVFSLALPFSGCHGMLGCLSQF